ncbi:3-phosphoshikimate 1-carboxyvinyltransferase [Woodsholea maritima]|uniref:3-phosphoshikimate 1-carboxyvinyltransferase n=1 Tax=Woodsholea maritima TaxID=240237 RepID=UPI00037FEC85|nr:3-phosphoshikimate 1-carboxyvinyltransferase [Woodsholea maritima]
MSHNASSSAPQAQQGSRKSFASQGLKGRLAAAPDKSISHRALIFSALANGTTRIENLLESGDVLATAKAVAQFGANVEHVGPGEWSVTGCPIWKSPKQPVDLGNSGTAVRLLMGAASRFALTVTFVGDESLSKRPMERVLGPLRTMGVEAEAQEGGRLPVRLTGASPLHPISYAPPIASAQVKSAILLAGLGAEGVTTVEERISTRDHSERMAPLFGCPIVTEHHKPGRTVRIAGPITLQSADHVHVPGDPSSAAFLIAAALITPDSEITVCDVLTNPARFGLYEVLKTMGADLTFTPAGERAGEELVHITARTSTLKGVKVPASRAASMIDEYPILSVIAANAEGTTKMEGLGELRAKESDRLAASAAMLQANGVKFELGPDTLTVHGQGLGSVPGGGLTETHHDHRLAMSGLILGLSSKLPSKVDDVAMIATSYPTFFDDMAQIGARIESE